MNNSQQWFENVENFQPLRGGRKGDTLNKVASTNKVTVDEAEKKFQTEIADSAQQEDPLATMCSYVIWFEEHFTSGKRKFFYPILYKICVTYCTMSAYKNDERIMKLWIKLAENFPESSLAVMEFAFLKGSCRNLAKFYIHWSRMYQSIGWWNKAREKLQLAFRINAVPLDLLHKADDELEAHIMLACKQDAEITVENASDNTTENQRETLSRLRGIGRQHFAPIVRHPQGPPGVLKSSIDQSKKKATKMDRFEIFSDEHKQLSDVQEDGVPIFQTPLGTAKYTVKRSRVVESLAADSDFQALFGIPQEQVDLQITNEENNPKTPHLNFSKLPNMGLQTPIENSFRVFEDVKQQQPQQKAREEKKARLILRKELIRETSIEEAYAKKIMFL